MNLIVKSRELKWAGKILPRGAVIEPKSDRDLKHLDLLMKIGKVEEAPEPRPVGQVATTKPIQEPVAEPEPAPETVESADNAPPNGYLSKAEISARLDKLGVTHDPDVRRDALLALLKDHGG